MADACPETHRVRVDQTQPARHVAAVEQEKQLKYASLVANTIMLSNVADMTTVLSGMAADGHAVTPDLVAYASPYIRGHILRFGQYALDMGDMPPPLDPKPLPFDIA